MDDSAIQAFNDKMFRLMTAALHDLPQGDLIDLHNELVDQYEETEGSNQEAPVSFALHAVRKTLSERAKTRAMN